VTRDGFTGHEHLDNVGLVHMNGRVYDPAIARFLSPDPVVTSPFNRQDLNRYSYAWNSPLSIVDPTGLEEVTCLHGPHGRCAGVTVTGLRDRPLGGSAYYAWRTGSNGQVVSAAQRDPCGQDGSAAACAGQRGDRESTTPPAASAAAGLGFGGVLQDLGRAGLNLIPGWYYSGAAASMLERGQYLDAALFYGATVGDVFLLGRGLAMAQTSRALATPLRVSAGEGFGPVNPGPLSPRVASTFRSASYSRRQLDEPLVVYRLIGDGGNPSGRFWTTLEPKGALQSVIDLAIDQNWRNPATQVIRAEIPAGTVIYEGATSAQRGLVGGAHQIYIPSVDPGWLR
jgi:RHS repeat-associated protein